MVNIYKSRSLKVEVESEGAAGVRWRQEALEAGGGGRRAGEKPELVLKVLLVQLDAGSEGERVMVKVLIEWRRTDGRQVKVRQEKDGTAQVEGRN